MVRLKGGDQMDVLASHPYLNGDGGAAGWVFGAARGLLESGEPRATRLLPSAGPGTPGFACVPVGAEPGVWALYMLTHSSVDPHLVAERLTLSAAGLCVDDDRAGPSGSTGESDLLKRTLRTLAEVASYDRYAAVSMALCNQIASEWGCSRVSIGFLRGAYVRVEAMSHTERFVERSSLVQSLEAVMEECLDQDQEVVYPSEASSLTIVRAARSHAESQRAGALLSLPIRRGASPIGVLTLERSEDAPFALAEAAALRLLADAAAAPLDLARRYRGPAWMTAQTLVRSGLEAVVGPRYAWAKVSALCVAASILFFAFVPGVYRVRADARIEAGERRAVAGPYEGYLIESLAQVGDEVEKGQVLARLDASELLLRLGSLRAEEDGARREAALAQRERKDAEAQIARARVRRAEADIAFIERQIEQASIRAPAAGLIIAGEHARALGSPVRTGELLFEIGSLDSLRVEAFISEDQIADVTPGSKGSLVLLARPDVKIEIEVVRVDPIAEVRAGRNVFRAAASLSDPPAWLRPGMEGTARVTAGERSYPWIWTRRVVNWVRMKLWV